MHNECEHLPSTSLPQSNINSTSHRVWKGRRRTNGVRGSGGLWKQKVKPLEVVWLRDALLLGLSSLSLKWLHCSLGKSVRDKVSDHLLVASKLFLFYLCLPEWKTPNYVGEHWWVDSFSHFAAIAIQMRGAWYKACQRDKHCSLYRMKKTNFK